MRSLEYRLKSEPRFRCVSGAAFLGPMVLRQPGSRRLLDDAPSGAVACRPNGAGPAPLALGARQVSASKRTYAGRGPQGSSRPRTDIAGAG